ncbi:MAG: FxDxF family PEP-CTERM protein [Duganella sp.]
MRKLLAISMLAVLAAGVPAVHATAAVVDLSSLNRVGSATMAGGALQLTTADEHSAGAAWLDQAIGTGTSFSASFSFSMVGWSVRSRMADGIVLALQNRGNNVVGGIGADLGYANLNGSGASAVGSVIQSWNNNRVGLSIDGLPSSAKAAPFDLGGAYYVTGDQTVSYDAVTHELKMTGTLYDHIHDTIYRVGDSATVDLAARFGSQMYLGFTGATGVSYADQRITSLAVTAVPEPETYAMLLAGLGMMGFVARRRSAARA